MELLKDNPKVLRLISIKNLSGRLVISLSDTENSPAVGLAIHPMTLSSVVFPEPLGPFITVTLIQCSCSRRPGSELIGSADIENFSMSITSSFMFTCLTL
jgi:hypothetical protein